MHYGYFAQVPVKFFAAQGNSGGRGGPMTGGEDWADDDVSDEYFLDDEDSIDPLTTPPANYGRAGPLASPNQRTGQGREVDARGVQGVQDKVGLQSWLDEQARIDKARREKQK